MPEVNKPISGLYEKLKVCKNEEELKAEFCKFFEMKINAIRGIDHYKEGILFEFKFGHDLRNMPEMARALAQTMYYARLLKYSPLLIRFPLPPIICIVDKDKALFAQTGKFAKFYASQDDRYDWDRAASTPCPRLVTDITKSRCANEIYVYDLSRKAEEKQFIEKCREHLEVQMQFLDTLEKKSINDENFLDVFEYWNDLFGEYVLNGRKPSEYFFADIEQGKSKVSGNGQVLFSVEGSDGMVPKMLQMKYYEHFWQGYEKVSPSTMALIRQKADRITEDFRRRFTGEFYTPIGFAAKGLQYLERVIGKEWWKSGEYRFWDMAAGTGNLEFNLPSSALPFCYISTLDAGDADYCRKIFPTATCFQYDYLSDDVAQLSGGIPFDVKRKMPKNLQEDLANPKIKWIIFINPPFATANKKGGETGKKSKDTVSMTNIRQWMTFEGYGEASRELFTQFLFRISKEFKGKQAILCLYSKLKYLNSNNDQKIRDGFFQYTYKRGFIFPIKCFYGAKGNFPVGFLIWDLAKHKHLEKQRYTLDVFDEELSKIGRKRILSIKRDDMLNKWCPRPKWDGHSIMPTLASGINIMDANKDKRNHVAPGFLFSMTSKGDDFQNQNAIFVLSAPYANAGAFSVTPANFEKAMVLHAVKKIPKATWTNDRDSFYAPKCKLPEEFVIDCVIWSAFADSNNCAALRNVRYQGRDWQIINNLHPFLLHEMRGWHCSHPGIAAQMAVANEDRFLAKWLQGKTLSPEAQAVLDAAKCLFWAYFAEIVNTPWLDYKIETWDMGLYQIRLALKAAGLLSGELNALKETHRLLGDKLLPQIYSLGFLNEDVEYFE